MASKVLVVGSGCIGLRTTLELLRNNTKVVLRSARPPLHSKTCSQGAGGLWMPFHCDDDRVTRWSTDTLEELLEKVSSSSSSSSECPIEILPSVQFHKINHLHPKTSKKHALPEWTKDERLSFQAMSLDMLFWQNNIHKLRIPHQKKLEEAGYMYNWLFFTPVVDPPKMLKIMYEEIISNKLAVDVNVNTGKEYSSIDEIVQEAIENDCDAVVNCTGMGSQDLCNDSELVGARGILFHYDRNCARWTDPNMINDAVLGADDSPWGGDQPCYMIPRGDILAIGGSYLEGDKEKGIRLSERIQLEQNANLMGIDTERAKPIGEWTGFRPYRPGVRLEIDTKYGKKEGVNVVHNYGHGGSGWTVFVGAAKEVARLLGK